MLPYIIKRFLLQIFDVNMWWPNIMISEVGEWIVMIAIDLWMLDLKRWQLFLTWYKKYQISYIKSNRVLQILKKLLTMILYLLQWHIRKIYLWVKENDSCYWLCLKIEHVSCKSQYWCLIFNEFTWINWWFWHCTNLCCWDNETVFLHVRSNTIIVWFL